MTLSRRITLLLSGCFLVVSVGAGTVAFRLAGLSGQASRIAGSLGTTLKLNQELREGVDAELAAIRKQVEEPGTETGGELRRLQYEVGAKQAGYLTLDIGTEERLALVASRSLHDEMAVRAHRALATIGGGDHAATMRAVRAVEEVERRLERTLERLNGLQIARLDRVLLVLDRTSRRSVAGFFAVAALLVAIVAVLPLLLQAQVIRPLGELLRAAEAIRAGDFSARATARRDDEVGRLAHAFNFMAASLAASYAELERRVAERTAALRRTEQELRQSEKLGAIGQLVSGVAHELNNPLTAILGFAEVVERALAARGAPEHERRMMRDVIVEAERSRRIVSDLLQFARREEPRREPVRLNELVGRTVRLREYELETRNVSVARRLAAADPLLLADAQKLQQVVLNLLNNAWEAVQETARPGRIVLSTSVSDGRAVLEVRDDGPGIRDVARVFEPFYTTKPVGKGTGLGLSVCYGIVAEHGGDMSAENLEGGGALFRVTLPLAPAGTAPPEAPESPAPERKAGAHVSTAGIRALVVDDARTVLQLQHLFLSRMGISSHAASSADEALAFLETRDVDLVISDARMPGALDGVGLFAWIREHRPALARHFLLISGDTLGLGSGELPRGTGVASLQKPFRFEEYEQAVRRIVEGA